MNSFSQKHPEVGKQIKTYNNIRRQYMLGIVTRANRRINNIKEGEFYLRSGNSHHPFSNFTHWKYEDFNCMQDSLYKES